MGRGGVRKRTCGGCHVLRKECTDCISAPHFPAYQPDKFAVVYKLFGAQYIKNTLKDLPQGQRADAVMSLVHHASIRIRDPVHGCLGKMRVLEQQVQLLQNNQTTLEGQVQTLTQKLVGCEMVLDYLLGGGDMPLDPAIMSNMGVFTGEAGVVQTLQGQPAAHPGQAQTPQSYWRQPRVTATQARPA